MQRPFRCQCRAAALAEVLLVTGLLLALAANPLAAQSAPFTATVTIDASHPIATFRPERAWGAALDGQQDSEVAEVYTPHNIAAMNSAGLGPVSYRLRTELAIEAWHWNPAGRWSDSANRQGYWTSDDHSSTPITVSYGYRLPRRGSTVDNGNNDGYSRIDDGDTTTCWKSNPYLDSRYTGVHEALHPQWIVVDLGHAQPVNAMHLWWGNPYPLRYRLDYWDGDQTQRIDWNPEGRWRPWPEGAYRDGVGGEVIRRLSPKRFTTRFVRITLLASSRTAEAGNGDPRDSVGFAIREIGLGTLDNAGHFHDLVRHGPSREKQSAILVSSTDPWHRAVDRDPDVEQPGLDLVFASGLTHLLPALLPVGVLFDTPDNAAALLRFVRSRGYPVERIELGEEPDGQRITPEDYAALYLQAAQALHRVDPGVALGGPSWQSARNDTIVAWPPRATGSGRSSWVGRFLDYLAGRNASGEFRFFSFEWYPFDDPCTDTGPQLAQAPAILAAALDELRADGLADSIPRIMTEYGYSAFGGPADVEISSALLNSEAVAGFFAHGGSEAYVYGIEPGSLLKEPHCSRWGNNLLFLGDDDRQAQYRMPAYLRRLDADPRLGRFRGWFTPALRRPGAGRRPEWRCLAGQRVSDAAAGWPLGAPADQPRSASRLVGQGAGRGYRLRTPEAARGPAGVLAVFGCPVSMEGGPGAGPSGARRPAGPSGVDHVARHGDAAPVLDHDPRGIVAEAASLPGLSLLSSPAVARISEACSTSRSLLIALAAATQLAAQDPRQVTRMATLAVEGDSADQLAARWSARLAADSTDPEALLGLATIARLTYRFDLAHQLVAPLIDAPGSDTSGWAIQARLLEARALTAQSRFGAADSLLALVAAQARASGDRAAEAEALLARAVTQIRITGPPGVAVQLRRARILIPVSDTALDAEWHCSRAALLAGTDRLGAQREARTGTTPRQARPGTAHRARLSLPHRAPDAQRWQELRRRGFDGADRGRVRRHPRPRRRGRRPAMAGVRAWRSRRIRSGTAGSACRRRGRSLLEEFLRRGLGGPEPHRDRLRPRRPGIGDAHAGRGGIAVRAAGGQLGPRRAPGIQGGAGGVERRPGGRARHLPVRIGPGARIRPRCGDPGPCAPREHRATRRRLPRCGRRARRGASDRQEAGDEGVAGGAGVL